MEVEIWRKNLLAQAGVEPEPSCFHVESDKHYAIGPSKE